MTDPARHEGGAGGRKAGEYRVSGRDLGEMAGGWGVPEEEIGMGHEVGDALEHAPGLEDERRERHLVQIHSHPGASRQPREDDRHGHGYAGGVRDEWTYLS